MKKLFDAGLTCSHRRTRVGGKGGRSPPCVRHQKSHRPKFLGEDLCCCFAVPELGIMGLKIGPTAPNFWQSRPKLLTSSKNRLGPRLWLGSKICLIPPSLIFKGPYAYVCSYVLFTILGPTSEGAAAPLPVRPFFWAS